MTSELIEELAFRRVAGEQVRALATIGRAADRVGEFLTMRPVVLSDGTQLRQLRVLEGPDRATGYERLDNEILAGRRLHKAAGGDVYPISVSCLYGDTECADGLPAASGAQDGTEAADPYALLVPYLGEPLHAVVSEMMPDEQESFEVSLLAGLCWLEAAGIAHRGLSPWTVRWDSDTRQAQVTDFSLSTVFGVPREAIGPPKWVGPEQRPGDRLSGLVTARDDMHSFGRLIYYVRSLGKEISHRDQLAEFEIGYLSPLFGAPDERLTAGELLASRGSGSNPIPRGSGGDMRLENGRKRFDARRHDKHPEATGPGGQDGVTGEGMPGKAPSPPLPPTVPVETVPVFPAMPAANRPAEPADPGKRPRWRRGNRS